jgi:hypothetical protein
MIVQLHRLIVPQLIGPNQPRHALGAHSQLLFLCSQMSARFAVSVRLALLLGLFIQLSQAAAPHAAG